ncbi:MAG: PIG-L family deacetylase [Gemmatimonadaceae bacterium]|nr:PIG-L family deacetylase [Gemmatimonadaceae bacterium]
MPTNAPATAESSTPTRALVILAHPDDPEFGAGGTVARWVDAGIEVHYVIVTDGSKGSGDPAMTPTRLAAIRVEEQRAAAAVLGVGVASLWRRSRLATLLMFLPVLVTLMAVVAAGHNLWPRFFFFAAAFIVVAAIRGGWVLVHWLVRWRPAAVATGGAAAVAAMSLLTVPRAWQPKQQFQAAYDFAEAERRPGDEVVALDIAYHVYFLQGKGGNWRFTSSLTMLGDAERSGPRTWVVYTLPARLRAVAPALFDYLAPPRYELIRTFPATVGGGEIHVLRHDATVHD